MELNIADLKKKYASFSQVFDTIDTIDEQLNRLSGYLLNVSPSSAKLDEQLVTFQQPAKRIKRPTENDRVFPLDTVELQKFRTIHHADIEDVIIHTGPYANELTRSLSALAITIGSEVYFRDTRYNPGSEESRKILNHELTHVVQYEEGRLFQNETKESLEEEARHAENEGKYGEGKLIVLNVNGRIYKFPKSQMKHYAGKAAKNIKNWIMDQRSVLDERDYLKLLYSYQKWLRKAT